MLLHDPCPFILLKGPRHLHQSLPFRFIFAYLWVWWLHSPGSLGTKSRNFNKFHTIPVRSCQYCIVISIGHFGLSPDILLKVFLAWLWPTLHLDSHRLAVVTSEQACCEVLRRCDLGIPLRPRHPMTPSCLLPAVHQLDSQADVPARLMSQLGWLKMCCGVNKEWARRKKRSILRLMVLPLRAMSC